MKTLYQGSSVIMVLLVFSIMSVIALGTWKTTAYWYELSLQRSHYQKHFAMTQGLLTYGISLVKSNAQELLAQKQTVTLSVDTWPGKPSKNKGIIVISPRNNHITVRAQVFNDNKIVCGLSCLITQEKTEKDLKPLIVSDWAIDGAT